MSRDQLIQEVAAWHTGDARTMKPLMEVKPDVYRALTALPNNEREEIFQGAIALWFRAYRMVA